MRALVQGKKQHVAAALAKLEEDLRFARRMRELCKTETMQAQYDDAITALCAIQANAQDEAQALDALEKESRGPLEPEHT